MSVPLDDFIGLDSDERSHIADLVSEHSSMLRILNWAKAQAGAVKFLDAVAQDEFSHDVLVRIGPERVLSYDSD